MNILDLLKDCSRIGISGHENPDGDCVGACCGMALFLRKMMPEAKVDIYLETFAASLERNIPGSDTILHEIPDPCEKYDAFIVLDSDPGRTGKACELFDQAKIRINIDHHRTNRGGGEFNYIDGNASSASELVYNVIGRDRLNAQIARALYVGIVTDTGVFQYSNTGESTMAAAGHLMTFGFDASAIIREVFFERTVVNMRALGTALVKAELIMGGKFQFCMMDRKELASLGARRKDLDGIPEQMLLTEGVDCAAYIHEDEDGFWRVSFRSREIVDVSRTASILGGGGHIRAAGATIRTGISQAIVLIKADIEKQLHAGSQQAAMKG